jgi:hypothetical protein
MMGGYYESAKGLLRLLRPPTREDSCALNALVQRKADLIPASGTPDVLKEYGIPVSALTPIR